jgi:TonB-dependent SusC/RagA subfamily outer membrane receptor
MKKVLMGLLLALPFYSVAQQNLKTIRKSSWQTLVYAISAADAEQFIKWDSIPVKRFENVTPVVTAFTDSLNTDTLPIGHYVQLNIVDNNINAEMFNNTNLVVLTVNNKHRLQLDVRTKTGELQTAANAFLKGKALKYNNDSKTFWIKQHHLDEAVIKVCTPADTTFIQLAKLNDYNHIDRQRRQNYRLTKIYKVLNFVPSKIKSIFKPRYNWNKKTAGARGYIIFNQPKYKPLDTVKFKGYVVDKKWKQYKKNIDVYLEYYEDGETKSQLLYTLKPVTNGAFTGEFILADSIPIDISCDVSFRTTSKKNILRSSFRIEDYVLEDMGSFGFTADKRLYYKDDSIHFTASSKDANGLNVMDASATLIVTATSINDFYRDSMFVADTIYREEKQLLTTTDTKFAVPTNNFPAADLQLNAKLIFKNSNNELHEETESLSFMYQASDIIVTQDADSIKAVCKQNGQSINIEGQMKMNGGNAVAIQFPYTAKVDPITEDYTFYIKNKTTGKLIKKEFATEDNYKLSLIKYSKADTLGFDLANPNKIPIYFTVLNGNKIIATGRQSDATISWRKLVHNHRQSYKVRWQYIWAGKEKSQEQNIGLLYKLLDVKISGSQSVFPGQKDSVKIEIKDYKGTPAANVNLTAVSYNNQLSKNINVPQPPYLARYKSKHFLQWPGFENDGDYLLDKKYALGKNKSWINTFHLDSMTYYKLLFPYENYFDAVTLTDEILPQLSVNVVQQGVPQEIYLLYINRNLVYYNGVTDKANYAFKVMPENVQIGIRLKDRYIEIDSLYMQPHYKHDLSFDLDKLPPHSTVTKAEKYFSYAEISLLEKTMLQLTASYISNYAYVWQNNTVIKLDGNRRHIAGPFTSSEMTFYNPGNFDISFNFENGYEYSLSKQVARLEKKNIFWYRPKKNFLYHYGETALILGDTVVAPPAIDYSIKKEQAILKFSPESYKYTYYGSTDYNKGKLQYTFAKDSAITYAVLRSNDDSVPLVLSAYRHIINNIEPGRYNLYLVTDRSYVLEVANIEIKIGGTTCIKTDSLKYYFRNNYIDSLVAKQQEKLKPVIEKKTEPVAYKYEEKDKTIYTAGNSRVVSGKIIDAKGNNPVPFVSIKIKGTSSGVMSDAAGSFVIKVLRQAKQILMINALGYMPLEVSVDANEENKVLQIKLQQSTNRLQEVVVSGAYGVKRSVTSASSVTVSGDELQSVRVVNINGALAGRVAGIQIRGQSSFELDHFAADSSVMAASKKYSYNSLHLYVIDGIVYNEMPKNINTDDIQEVSVLQDAAAIAIYGERAANGVMVITTKTKTFRKQFRDYAFWQPNFFTDKNGKASFEVTYPDNITGWKTFVVAMDKKRRIGKASVLTQSYKPIVAQLSVPQFLIAGDSAAVIGKAINYTADKYNIALAFSINDAAKNTAAKELPANESLNEEQFIIANSDTVKTTFTVETTTGFKDGEERKIPVFKKGTEEAAGNFWVLQNDTTVNFAAAANSSELHLYAQNNTLDVLLNEIEHLKEYPFYCMEQTASKLTGYAMEKKIKDQLNQPFKNDNEMKRLLGKLQKAQLFDGGWAWWENGKTNFYITNYIATALQNFRNDPLVETNVRNAFLYLQNQLPYLERSELLAALATLSNGHHQMNYEAWLNKIHYDSLTQHQQWQWVKIKQQQKLDYAKEIKTLVDKKIATQLGGTHWGEDNYSWYSNATATTVIAYAVLQNEEQYKYMLPSITQYFLEKRKLGYWINTVESASIVSTILPGILQQQKNFMQPAVLQVNGDSSFAITKFPYALHTKAGSLKNISITKSGGGLVYLTAYQKIFNANPLPVNDKFIVQTSFQKNGQNITSIKAGEKIKMIITVNVLKDADYVMLEVPIPAGCNYAMKNNGNWQTYREYYKNKMMLFAESLKTGMHQFEIELEPRYNGTYTLNPAKAELMYYPTFFGRNEIKKVAIF